MKLKRLSLLFTFKANPPRPPVKREKTEDLLSYYESSIPNDSVHPYARPPSPLRPNTHHHHHHQRSLSSGSTSSSDYSDNTDTDNDTRDGGSETSSSATKRLNAPSKGSGDRRRVAIVEMDTVEEAFPKTGTLDTHPTRPGSIRQRRGYRSNLAGLALVAPPDAAVRTYTRLTPPSTAPLASASPNQTAAHQYDRSHHRSTSELTPSGSKPFLPRDASATNGQGGFDPNKSNFACRYPSKDQGKTVSYNGAVPVPASLSSSTRSPTRSDPPQPEHGLLSPRNGPPSAAMCDPSPLIFTPEIGQAKEIHIPVAGPIVVDLEKATSREKTTDSSKVSPKPVLPSSSLSLGAHGRVDLSHPSTHTSLFSASGVLGMLRALLID